MADTSPQPQPTRPSPFLRLAFDKTHTWQSLCDALAPDLDKAGLERLKTVLEGKCQCVFIEKEYIDKDYRDTFSNFHSKRFQTPSSRCTRLHFFSEVVNEQEIVDAGEQPEENAEAEKKRTAVAEKLQRVYLGYSVIRPTKPNCIGRTMLTHHLRGEQGGHLSMCKDELHLFGTRLKDRLVVDTGSAYNGRQLLQKARLTGNNSYSLFKLNLHTL